MCRKIPPIAIVISTKPIVDCVENIDELVFPSMPKFHNVVADDIVIGMPCFSTPVSKPKSNLTSSNYLE
jgi:hypothetical protein